MTAATTPAALLATLQPVHNQNNDFIELSLWRVQPKRSLWIPYSVKDEPVDWWQRREEVTVNHEWDTDKLEGQPLLKLEPFGTVG